MYHYTYITTNKINGLQYVGDRSCKCNPSKDPYLGSGRPLFKRALKKYGRENFDKEILEIFENKEEAFLAQEKYIKKYNTLVPKGYNISPKGGLGVKGCFSHTDNSKAKISKNGSGISRNKGIKKTQETKDKISKTLKNKYKNKEIINGMSGSILSDEAKKKIGNSKRGIKLSDEHKLKISQNNARNKPWLGKKMSKETRDKMSKSRMGKKRGSYKKTTSQSAYEHNL